MLNVIAVSTWKVLSTDVTLADPNLQAHKHVVLHASGRAPVCTHNYNAVGIVECEL